jgi:hypothetical protein
MPVKRRTNKKRDALSDDAIAFLEGRPCGFFEFKHHDELVLIWETFGNPEVATWDMGRDTKPVARC